jgi:hypothetical protein
MVGRVRRSSKLEMLHWADVRGVRLRCIVPSSRNIDIVLYISRILSLSVLPSLTLNLIHGVLPGIGINLALLVFRQHYRVSFRTYKFPISIL